jgi:hypothetical protein
MIVATVLKTGGDFKPEHVILLRDQIARHTPAAKFICLSDVAIDGVNTIPLVMGWPGWWSKIELFRPGIFCEPVVYFDIDTVILSDVAGFERMNLTMLEDPLHGGPASGIMAWGYDYSHVFQALCEYPSAMTYYHQHGYWGDQGFIRDNCRVIIELFKDKTASYKVHAQHAIPNDTAVLYFHGYPRPWDTDIYKRVS